MPCAEMALLWAVAVAAGAVSSAAGTQPDSGTFADAATRGAFDAMFSRMVALENSLLEERQLWMADRVAMDKRLRWLEDAHANSGRNHFSPDRVQADSAWASRSRKQSTSGQCNPSQIPARSA